ncbi:TPA: hypothetical protein NO612_004771 [Klebsiella pneumoniae]|nr:hypothetical protein [Klebsiella pneumoniae]EMD7472354.1 hypothetical protein [Salmonella enterica]EME3402686.1 hypothetical protein [Salmonella enterica]HCI4323162.1 hypothetical protein [Klebsiella pneumoniae]
MFKKILVAAVMATTLSSSLSAIAAPSVQVGFSPEGTAQELVLKTINNAQSSVRMLGYNLTAADIAKALASASRRGVDVKVILIRGARRIRKKSYAKVFRASVRAETSRLPVCGSAARRNRRLG